LSELVTGGVIAYEEAIANEGTSGAASLAESGQQIDPGLELVVEGAIDQVQPRARARPKRQALVRRDVIVKIEVECGHVAAVAHDQFDVGVEEPRGVPVRATTVTRSEKEGYDAEGG
jgi:hypothetical protein